jgi:hypothetical protein
VFFVGVEELKLLVNIFYLREIQKAIPGNVLQYNNR